MCDEEAPDVVRVVVRGLPFRGMLLPRGNEAAEITFEYRPKVGFPGRLLGQTGWTTRTLTVDGRSADPLSYDA